MTKDDNDNFWDALQIPMNEDWRENGLQLVNPVEVAEKFMECTSLAAFQAQQAEDLIREKESLAFQRTQALREMRRLKRIVLARNFKGITKSANADMLEAYLLSVMTEQEVGKFAELEAEIDVYSDEIGKREPRLGIIESRLKRMDKTLDYMKQYLDYHKLETRVSGKGRF